MKKFKFEDYQGKYVMWCKTEEEAKKFGKIMNIYKKDIFWVYNICWTKYKGDTCYDFNQFTFCLKNFYEDNNYTILNFSDFDWSEDKMFTKADLKTGDFIVREDGDVEVVLVEYNAMVCQHGGFNTLTGLNINDIAKIYRPRDNRNCSFNNYKNGFIIYERPEEVEMTIEEISKALGKKVKVVG